jgi:hypothetical protein
MDTDMELREVKLLAEKVKEGVATPEEELQLLKYLNKGVEEMRMVIKEIATKE